MCAPLRFPQKTAHDRTIADRIKGFLNQHFHTAREYALSEADHLLANGILDSLGFLDPIGYLEQESGITMVDNDLVPEDFQAMRRLTAFVQEKQGVASR